MHEWRHRARGSTTFILALLCSYASQNLNDFFELNHEELRGELYPRSGIEGGGQSLRIHELYQKFLGVVKANLEGMVPPPLPTTRTMRKL